MQEREAGRDAAPSAIETERREPLDASGGALHERQLRLLLRAGEVLGSSLDIRETVQQAVALMVPELADWCTVDLVDDDGRAVGLVAVAHQDPKREEWARGLRQRHEVQLDAPGGLARVIRTGESLLVPVVTRELLEASTEDALAQDVLEQVGFRSVIIAPLSARGSTIGALTLVWSDSERHYDQRDVLFAEELARRVALAVDNARLFEQTQDLNTTLERRVAVRSRQVQELASEVTLAETRERGRIARLLHDDLQQRLHVLHFQLEEMRSHALSPAPEAFERVFGESRNVLRKIVADVRSLTSELSPVALQIEDFGAALEWLAQRFREQHGLQVTVHAAPRLRIPREAVRELLFSLVRECLFNVVKHADVEHARITMSTTDEWVRVEVADDGGGFDPGHLDETAGEGTGLGLRSAAQRLRLYDGELQVESHPHRQGVRVTISVPQNALVASNGAGGE